MVFSHNKIFMSFLLLSLSCKLEFIINKNSFGGPVKQIYFQKDINRLIALNKISFVSYENQNTSI